MDRLHPQLATRPGVETSNVGGACCFGDQSIGTAPGADRITFNPAVPVTA
jgi:hypothetical protein